MRLLYLNAILPKLPRSVSDSLFPSSSFAFRRSFTADIPGMTSIQPQKISAIVRAS